MEAEGLTLVGAGASDAGEDAPQDLVSRARAGDSAAFERLLRQHERQVLRTALRLLGNLEDAQDAAQEVFLRLHRNLGRIDESRELAAWLYRVAVNVCRDIERRRGAHLVPIDSVNLPVGSEDPESEAELAERRRAVSRALARLPRKERAAVVLRDVEGLSTFEVARILGSSESTVRSQISRAREKLATFLRRRS